MSREWDQFHTILGTIRYKMVYLRALKSCRTAPNTEKMKKLKTKPGSSEDSALTQFWGRSSEAKLLREEFVKQVGFKPRVKY